MINMRLIALAALGCNLMYSAHSAHAAEGQPAIEPVVLPATAGSGMTLQEEGGYLLGLNLAMEIQKAKAALGELDNAQILEGINDVLNDKKFKVDPRVRGQIVFGQLQKAATAANDAVFNDNVKKGADFLAQLKGKGGVIFTDSGIAYEILKSAKGQQPVAASTVSVHYHGTHIDGSVFDSSVVRKVPAEFPLNGVIKGWTEGLQLMNVGAKFRFYIPQNLAYGQRGSQDRQTGEYSIFPGELLIFEVELLKIIK